MRLRYAVWLGYIAVVTAAGCSSTDRSPRFSPPLPDPAAAAPGGATAGDSAGDASPRARQAGGEITLPEALALALERNGDLAAAEWAVRAREGARLQAGLWPNPELSAEVENVGGTGTRSGFDAAETTLWLGQPLELGGRRSRRIELAERETGVAARERELVRVQLLAEVAAAYVDVVAAQSRLALTDETVRLSEDLLQAVSERVKAGRVPAIDESKARVVLSDSRIERERAARALESARVGLSLTWGEPDPPFDRAAGDLTDTSPLPDAADLNARAARSPALAWWDAEIERARASLALEESRAVPGLSIGAGIRRAEETDDTAFLAGIEFPLPLFDRNQGAIAEARAGLALAERARGAAEARLLRSLAEARRDLASELAALTALRDDIVPGAEGVFEAVREGYRTGKFGYLDVLDAQRTLFEARARLVDAQAAYRYARARVEALLGGPLEAVDTDKGDDE